jgi:hypothetical protein
MNLFVLFTRGGKLINTIRNTLKIMVYVDRTSFSTSTSISSSLYLLTGESKSLNNLWYHYGTRIFFIFSASPYREASSF